MNKSMRIGSMFAPLAVFVARVQPGLGVSSTAQPGLHPGYEYGTRALLDCIGAAARNLPFGYIRAMNDQAAAQKLSMTQVLLCGAAIVTVSMGIRHGFGLWLQPITMDRGWTRETFAFALAVQNLAWGIAGPVAGMVADRFGAFNVLAAGSLLDALGLVTMALATSGLACTCTPRLLLGSA